MSIYLCISLCVYECVNTHRSQKRISDTLRLYPQLFGFEPFKVSAENQTQVLYMSSKNSQMLSIFPAPAIEVLCGTLCFVWGTFCCLFLDILGGRGFLLGSTNSQYFSNSQKAKRLRRQPLSFCEHVDM